MEAYTKTLNDAFNQITIVYHIFFPSDNNPPLTYILSEKYEKKFELFNTSSKQGVVFIIFPKSNKPWIAYCLTCNLNV